MGRGANPRGCGDHRYSYMTPVGPLPTAARTDLVRRAPTQVRSATTHRRRRLDRVRLPPDPASTARKPCSTRRGLVSRRTSTAFDDQDAHVRGVTEDLRSRRTWFRRASRTVSFASNLVSSPTNTGLIVVEHRSVADEHGLRGDRRGTGRPTNTGFVGVEPRSAADEHGLRDHRTRIERRRTRTSWWSNTDRSLTNADFVAIEHGSVADEHRLDGRRLRVSRQRPEARQPSSTDPSQGGRTLMANKRSLVADRNGLDAQQARPRWA
jgi:hypothetical protein